jgi:hypothetical protein
MFSKLFLLMDVTEQPGALFFIVAEQGEKALGDNAIR